MNLIHNDKLLETMKENMSKLIEEFEHSDLYKDTKKEMEKDVYKRQGNHFADWLSCIL